MTSDINSSESSDLKAHKTPRARFQKVGIDRAENIVKAIEVFGKCHNRYTYEYKEDEIKKIFKHLRTSLRETEALFLNDGKKNNGSVFSNLRE